MVKRPLISILSVVTLVLVSSCGASASGSSTGFSEGKDRIGWFCVERDRVYTYDGKPFAVVGEHRSCGN